MEKAVIWLALQVILVLLVKVKNICINLFLVEKGIRIKESLEWLH